jgi:hypothetical protein
MKRLEIILKISLFGALGGLAGSYWHQIILMETLSQPLNFESRLFYLALLGILVGAPIGFFPNFAEAWERHSFWGAIHSGLIGAMLGAIGGMIALPLAELLHNFFGGGFKGRVIALALFGLCIGMARRSLIGGLVGGIVAGIALEFLVIQQETHNDSGIFALIIIGFFISFFVSLLQNYCLERNSKK